MKKQKKVNSFRKAVLIAGLLLIGFGSQFNQPVNALGPFLRINVTPSNVSFKIVDAENPEDYYTGSQEVTVVTKHIFPLLILPWYLGIRSADGYLQDSLNPNNRIPISQLRWSLDGRNFTPLTQQWTLVNSYFAQAEKPQEETISYRLYPEPNQILPAGLYSARIEFDARWLNLPWR
ncbi:MAG: hypothetical protein GX075_06690 [Firmicutes bacterium]|nr:hypothetical protein [Bacillota bacterium]